MSPVTSRHGFVVNVRPDYDDVGDDYEADMARVQLDEESQRWWQLTNPCQTPFGVASEGELRREMEPAWHMD